MVHWIGWVLAKLAGFVTSKVAFPDRGSCTPRYPLLRPSAAQNAWAQIAILSSISSNSAWGTRTRRLFERETSAIRIKP